MLQKFLVAFSIALSVGLIWFALSIGNEPSDPISSIRVEGGTQIIHVLARGGYSPRQIVAKADMPTVLEIETKGTYDCSLALNIPKVGFKKSLPNTGTTKIEVPREMTNGNLDGVCAMGMYSFTVDFQP